MPHSTTRDGVRIYFEEHGRGEPVLLAYGIGGNAGMWEPNIEALSAHHRLILWEPRGHARSDNPEDPRKVTFAHWVLDLHDLMDHLKIERAVVGGLDAMAEFAIASNPNVAGRIRLDPSARKEIFDYYRMLTPIGYANALRALLQMDYITDRLGEIQVPTLLVCGDEDPSLGPMREIRTRIPQSTFALLSPAGHFANRDQPETFNRAVVEFLTSLA